MMILLNTCFTEARRWLLNIDYRVNPNLMAKHSTGHIGAIEILLCLTFVRNFSYINFVPMPNSPRFILHAKYSWFTVHAVLSDFPLTACVVNCYRKRNNCKIVWVETLHFFWSDQLPLSDLYRSCNEMLTTSGSDLFIIKHKINHKKKWSV